jgi:hypothetical protein
MFSAWQYTVLLIHHIVAGFHGFGKKNQSSKLRLLHTMNVRFSLLDIAQRILGVTLPNFQ